MPEHTEYAPSQTRDSSVVLTWTTHLARRHPAKLILSLSALALVAAAGYYALGALGSVAAVFVLTAAMEEFLFPVRFTLTGGGAAAKTLTRTAGIDWKDVRRCYRDQLGLKLSPLGRASRIEAFRGVYLRFDGNQDQVVCAVKSLMVNQC